MPLTPPSVAAILAPALVGCGNLGISVPQLSLGIGIGVCLWTSSTLTAVSVDVGTLGVGVGTFPCLIPPVLLLGGFFFGLPAAGILGPAMPLLATGLTLGLSAAFPTGLITTAHPTVGTGVATVTFPGPSSVPSMIAGFAAAGIIGIRSPQLATGIGLGLDLAFASFAIPIPIVGAPAPASAGGVGGGKII